MNAFYAYVPFSFASSPHPFRFRGRVPLLVLGLACLAGLESRESVRASCSLNPHESGVALGGQEFVGQPLARDGRHDTLEPSSVVGFALVESERLFVGVPLQVERSD